MAAGASNGPGSFLILEDVVIKVKNFMKACGICITLEHVNNVLCGTVRTITEQRSRIVALGPDGILDQMLVYPV